MYKLLNKYNKTFYFRIDDSCVDGEMIKNTSHGMGASLRKMFDFVMQEYSKLQNCKENTTDFDLNIIYGFPCQNKLYNFSYSKEGINVEIQELFYKY